MKRPQTERLLDRLLRGALCSMEPLRWEPPITRVAARIHELRKRGELIETEDRCPLHGGAAHAYYRRTGRVWTVQGP